MSMNLGTATAYIDLDASKFKNGMISVANGLNDFNNRSLSASDRFNALGNSMKTVGGGLTKAITLPLVGIGTASVMTAAKFEAGMSEVKAITGATGSDFKKLEDQAKDLGATTKFSATDAAEGMKYFGMAGYKTDQIMSALPATLDLAAAGGTDLGITCDIVSDAMTGLGMSANETGKFTDIMAATVTNANTNIELMGETLKYAGPVAGTLGINMADLSVAIGLMGNAGIKGSQAGTALRGGLTNLVKPTDDMEAAMKKYGVQLVKNDDGSVNLMNTMKLMRSNLGELDQATQAQALATIFGKEAMSGWAAVVNASDKDFDKLTQAIAGSEGKAKDMAEIMQDNLQGALTNLGSALEGAAISIGEALLPVIKTLTEWIQKAVDWFNNLDSGTKTTIVTIGGLIAVIGPLILIVGSLITAFTTIGSALSTVAGIFGITSGAAATAGGAIATTGGAAATAGGAMGALGGAAGILGGILTGGLVFALFGLIAKLGESREALGWLQDKFGSLGTVIGGVCEFIAGIWNLTIDNMINVGKLGFDVLAAMIDGPGGATVKDAFAKYSKGVEDTNKKAWDNITMKTTRELSQQKNSVDKETKEASDKAKTNTDKMAKDMTDNAKKGADGVGKEMKNTSKVVMDESGKIPKDVQSNMQKSVQAMKQSGSDIYNGMNTSFSKLASQGKQHFSDLYNGVTRSTSKMASQVISDWNRIKGALRGTITGNVQIKVHGVQAALNQIASVKNAAKTRSISPMPFSSFMAMAQSFAMPIDTNMYAQAYDMLRSDNIASYVSSQIPNSINLNIDSDNNKKSSKSSDRNINVEVKIDKFENKTSDSPKEIAEQVVDQVIYKIKRERYAMGGA